MTATRSDWPVKQRELQNVIVDSTRWNGFEFRDGDVVVGTWSKSGTTLTQQIIAELLSGGAGRALGLSTSPWIEFRLLPNAVELAEAQTERRVLKTHLPLDALVFSPRAKYIYVGRDARDVLWSMHHHHSSFSPQAYHAFNSVPNRVGPPLEAPNPDVRAYYHEWLDRDGHPFWPFWAHVQSWWNVRHLPNVLLVHFANLCTDLAGEARRIAAFLGIDVDERAWPAILEHCSLDYMRRQAKQVEFLDLIFDGGGETFIFKGTNGRWRDVLTQEEIDKCDAIAARELAPDCATWLRTGGQP